VLNEEGTVKRTRGNRAWVVTKRSTMCESCSSHGACKVLGGGKEMEVEAINIINAKVGDQVLLTLQEQSLVKLSFLVYMFPILALITGAALGQQLAPKLNMDSELSSFMGGALFFGLAFLLVKRKDRRLGHTGETIPKITRLIKES